MNKLHSIIRGREVYTLNHDWTVLEAARYMAEKRVGAAAVVDGGQVVGVFSERDLMTRVVVAGRSADSTLIAEVMTRDIVTASPDDTEEEGVRKMQQANCRHLPIIQDGHLLGFISMRDLLQVEIEERDQEIKLMNEYLHSTPVAVGR
jgi:CBS domain-containing protein